MSASGLSVWYQQDLVGEVGRDEDGEWWLLYSDAWVTRPGFPISPPLPLARKRLRDTRDRKSVRWFFENLLPEEGVRRQVAARLGVPRSDTWTLLEHLGGEVAGALSLLPLGESPTVEEETVLLAPEELVERIRKSRRGLPLLVSGRGARLSLAGAQEKMGVRLDDGGELFEPLGNTASTHILKPENSNPAIAFCPANEWICMQIAGEVGLKVPESRLLRFPEDETVFVVQRYDRAVEGKRIVRLHQLDLCQVLDLPPDQKYEGDGGPGARELFIALNRTRIPAVARQACLRWLLFNYLIGNDDAHAKNVSFLRSGDRLEVAPFYDLLCVQAYLSEGMPSMSIGGTFEPGQLRREDWERFSEEIQQDIRLVESEFLALLTKLPGVIERTLGSDVLTEPEREWFRSEALPRIEQRLGFARAALDSDQAV